MNLDEGKSVTVETKQGPLTITLPPSIREVVEIRKEIPLRDQFAMAALTGKLRRDDGLTIEVTKDFREMLATYCYMMADAMLKARGRK